MRRRSLEERRVISGFFVNIGVAWFAAGVISSFLSSADSTLVSYGKIVWCVVLSYVFLKVGVSFVKEKR